MRTLLCQHLQFTVALGAAVVLVIVLISCSYFAIRPHSSCSIPKCKCCWHTYRRCRSQNNASSMLGKAHQDDLCAQFEGGLD
ncbi:hypothetical protein BJX70DRAFT_43045 [Aspergillus crustosus]